MFIARWLEQVGLELKPSKTRITHTLQAYEGNVGFDFLCFTIRQFAVGKNRSGFDNKKQPLGFKTLIRPSTERVKRHSERLTQIIARHKSSSQLLLIDDLNPVIRGWSNYYSRVVSGKQFARLTHLTFRKLWRWSKRRHPRKSAGLLKNRYWPRSRGSWRFALEGKGACLFQHSDTRIARHVKVLSNRSPFDGDWVYWSSRMGKHPEVGSRLSFLLRQCAHCKLFLGSEMCWKLITRFPAPLGVRTGTITFNCYTDIVTTPRLRLIDMTRPKKRFIIYCQITEEPCEVKISRTVLKTNRRSDPAAEFNYIDPHRVTVFLRKEELLTIDGISFKRAID